MSQTGFRQEQKSAVTVVDAKPASETGFRQEQKSAVTEDAKPLSQTGFRQEQKCPVRVVDVKPVSETRLRQEQKTVEPPKPSPRDPNRSSAWCSSPPSPGSVGSVQILPESKLGAKPEKPERNFSVRYDPQSANAASGDGSQSVSKSSPENVTTSTARPVPRPRPRSMGVSHSEPMSISAMAQNDAKNDKQSAVARPEPPTKTTPPPTKRMAPKAPKGYQVVGASIWYDGNVNAPPRRPPPVKPKPVASPTDNEPDKTVEAVQPASAKVPPDVVRRKPTIIRPTPLSSAEQTVNPPASTMASSLQSQTAVTATASIPAVVSTTETNGWSKPVPHNEQSGTDTSGHAGVSEPAKPQAKQRPTIIKRNRPETVCTSELHSASADQEPLQISSQSSVEVTHSNADICGSENCSSAVVDLQRSEDRGSLTAHARQAVSRDSEHHDLRPLPRFQTQPLQSTDQELSHKIPPSKPPPPKLSNTTEEPKTTV